MNCPSCCCLIHIVIKSVNVKRKPRKAEVIKNVNKKGRLQHLPDSRLQSSLKHREPNQKIKYRAFSQHCGFHQLSTPLLSFFLLAAPANTLVSLHLQLMKPTVLTESSLYFIFSLGSLCHSNVYRHESGRSHTLPFFLTFFIISPFQVFLLY